MAEESSPPAAKPTRAPSATAKASSEPTRRMIAATSIRTVDSHRASAAARNQRSREQSDVSSDWRAIRMGA